MCVKYIAVSSTVFFLTLFVPFTNSAYEVKITPDKEVVEVLHDGRKVPVMREQDPNHVVDEVWAKTSRKCPPFCIQPNIPEEGVHNVSELEVLDFMENRVNHGTGVMIDARMTSWYLKETIPGSINIPFKVFDDTATGENIGKIFKLLGVEHRKSVVTGFSRRIEELFGSMGLFGMDMKSAYWDFTNAKDILLWCNGPWCGQSPTAIKNLVKLGYPQGKIYYYRGGMQMWKVLGLSTITPSSGSVIFHGE